MSERSPISKRLRYEVLRRDDFRCHYCGQSAEDGPLTVDHVQPVSLGGQTVPENLVASCRDCNAGKTSSTPDAPLIAGVSDDAIRWAAAMREAAEIQRANWQARDEYLAQFGEYWPSSFGLPRDWRADVERWYETGVEIELLLDCVDATLTAYGVKWYWRYFCGCVWKRIGQRQDIAREILGRDESEG